ncbi:MAG: ATP-binding protein, partial [Oscillospiraceae bacterium]
MKQFSINLEGRIKNFNLPKNKPLLPLFEAVVNSIHAIEERRAVEPDFIEGKIIINTVRDNQLILEGMTTELPEITGFEIIDNG